jgi:hypothetical protein
VEIESTEKVLHELVHFLPECAEGIRETRSFGKSLFCPFVNHCICPCHMITP